MPITQSYLADTLQVQQLHTMDIICALGLLMRLALRGAGQMCLITRPDMRPLLLEQTPPPSSCLG